MESFIDIALDILVDATKDTLLVVPFLFVTYLLMEWIEHKTSEKAKQSIQKAGAAGPVIGALCGVVPQCGFSAAAATLYAGRVITLGTLFAVFMSTSDEMLPIFIAEQVPLSTILGVLGTKVLCGMIMGFLVDFGIRRVRKKQPPIAIGELCELAGCHCDERCAGCEINCEKCHHVVAASEVSHEADACACASACACGHEHEEGYHDAHDHHHEHAHHEHGHGSIAMSALKHTLQITIFLFVVTIILNVILTVVGTEALADFVANNAVASIFASALVGLIPNCAASVLIADLYVEGVLGSGAMIAGLLVSAGVGLLILVRTNRHPKQNAAIIGGLYAAGVLCGLIVFACGISF